MTKVKRKGSNAWKRNLGTTSCIKPHVSPRFNGTGTINVIEKRRDHNLFLKKTFPNR
jgi:hypothetical protein